MIFGYGCQNGLALLGGVASLARRVVALAMAWVPQINGRLVGVLRRWPADGVQAQGQGVSLGGGIGPGQGVVGAAETTSAGSGLGPAP